MSHPVIFPKGLDVVSRWSECEGRTSVMCWRALAQLLLAYSRLEFHENRFAVSNDLLTLAELAKQRAIDLAPFEDMKEIAA